jgi:hypothetical protein
MVSGQEGCVFCPSHCVACKFARLKDFLRYASVFLLDRQILQAFSEGVRKDDVSARGDEVIWCMGLYTIIRVYKVAAKNRIEASERII